MRRLPWIIQVFPIHSHESLNGKTFLAVVGQWEVTREAESVRSYIADFEDEGRGQKQNL